MRYANVWVIEESWNKLEQGTEQVERRMLLVTGMVASTRALLLDSPLDTLSPVAMRRLFGRVLALLYTATREADALAESVDEVKGIISDRTAAFTGIMKERDPNKLVYEAYDEAYWVLQSAGVEPMVLMFTAEEMKGLGEDPFRYLMEGLQNALGFIGEEPQTEREGAIRAALVAALELSQRLATGAEAREWSDSGNKRRKSP